MVSGDQLCEQEVLGRYGPCRRRAKGLGRNGKPACGVHLRFERERAVRHEWKEARDRSYLAKLELAKAETAAVDAMLKWQDTRGTAHMEEADLRLARALDKVRRLRRAR